MRVVGIKKLPIDKLVPHPIIARKYTTEEVNDLVQSIREKGIIYPPKVRQKGDYYEILDGHRRVEAAKTIGYKEIKCEVVECSDEEAVDLAVQANEQREECSPADLGRQYDWLERNYCESHPSAKKRGGDRKKQTEESWVEQYSKKSGISKFKIYRCLRIYRNLPEEIKRKVVKRANFENQKLSGAIPEEMAEHIARVSDKKVQRQIYKIAVERQLTSEQVAQLVEKWEDGEDIDEIGNIDEWYPDFRRGVSSFRESRKILEKQTIFKFAKKEGKEFFSELVELKRSINNVFQDLKNRIK
jgi:ParB/RepB/Spo0J family partition protein